MKSKILTKIIVLMVSVSSFLTLSVAHGNENWSNSTMMHGGMMNFDGHMAGYTMWGMSLLWMLISLGLLVLIVLGIIYLVQKINRENKQ